MILRLAALLVAGALFWALLEAGTPAVDLGAAVRRAPEETGAAHPVTAVLLGYRAYDTLLEVAVLLLAVLACGSGRTGAPGAPRDPLLDRLAQALVPLMVLVAGYLLWAGAKQPGGAFQAAAVLAAAGVLSAYAGIVPTPDWHGRRWRLLLGAGLALFVALFVTASLAQALLALEAVLTVSIAAALLSLFAAGRG